MDTQRPPSTHFQQGPRSVQTGCLNWVIWLLLAALLFTWLLPSFKGGSSSNVVVNYSTFLTQVRANNVKDVIIRDATITGMVKTAISSQEGTTKSTHFTTTIPPFGTADLVTLLEQRKIISDQKKRDNLQKGEDHVQAHTCAAGWICAG